MKISVEINIKAPIEKVWECWTKPEHITNWNFASDDWSCPSATNDLRPNGTFNWRMEAKDGSMGFNFRGVYEEVKINSMISYKLEDGRMVLIRFIETGQEVKLSETFDAEGTNSDEMQRKGWQAILENFKKHVEAQ